MKIAALKNEASASTIALKSLESIKELDKSIIDTVKQGLINKLAEIDMLESEREERAPNLAAKVLAHIKSAFFSFLPELNDMRVSYNSNEIKLLLDKGGLTLEVQQLSQGEKSILTLIGDIARRLVLLNPSMKNPLHGNGIVLIDEIDLHLHPIWQQGIVSNLQKTFPNLQMVLTTHSPQVLSTVASSSIRIIREDKDGSINLKLPVYQTKGVLSADILSQIMFTDPKPDIKEAMWLDEFKDIIEDGDLDSDYAITLESKLIKHFGKDHPLMLECENLKKVRDIKRKLASRMQRKGE
ncbi:hypothetical protein ALQ63_01805 [Serratia plymuthica]|nr:hypothetical protein ALQ63_01805 [Serratia plymuthica]